MRIFEALCLIGHMVDAGNNGTFSLRIRDTKTLFVIDTKKLTIATDGKYDWEAGQALASALVKGDEVAELAWKGTDL